MRGAGRRNTLITLQRSTPAQDGYGEDIENWAEIGKEWAAVFWGRGSERRQAAMEQGAQPATFQVLDNALTRGLTIEDRVVLSGSAFDIEGIAPDTPRRGLIEITGVRAV